MLSYKVPPLIFPETAWMGIHKLSLLGLGRRVGEHTDGVSRDVVDSKKRQPRRAAILGTFVCERVSEGPRLKTRSFFQSVEPFWR